MRFFALSIIVVFTSCRECKQCTFYEVGIDLDTSVTDLGQLCGKKLEPYEEDDWVCTAGPCWSVCTE